MHPDLPTSQQAEDEVVILIPVFNDWESVTVLVADIADVLGG
jgi:hypothetical protein